MVVSYPHVVDNGHSVSEADPLLLLEQGTAILVTKMITFAKTLYHKICRKMVWHQYLRVSCQMGDQSITVK